MEWYTYIEQRFQVGWETVSESEENEKKIVETPVILVQDEKYWGMKIKSMKATKTTRIANVVNESSSAAQNYERHTHIQREKKHWTNRNKLLNINNQWEKISITKHLLFKSFYFMHDFLLPFTPPFPLYSEWSLFKAEVYAERVYLEFCMSLLTI